MKNILQTIIREAFNTAYKNHKIQNLNEDAAAKGEALSPESKAKADSVLNQVIANPEAGMNYQVYGPGKVTGGINMNQLNYIIDTLTELYIQTKDSKYKDAISFFFAIVKRPQSVNLASVKKGGKVTQTEKTSLQHTPMYAYIYGLADKFGAPLSAAYSKNPNAFEEAATRAWFRIFRGGTTIPTKDAEGNTIPSGQRTKVDTFDNLTKYYKSDSQGFFSVIATSFANDIRLQLQRELKFGAHIVSAPKTASGKDIDMGDEYGSGSENAASEAGSDVEDDILAVIGGAEEAGTEQSPEGYSFELENYKNAIRKAIQIAKETNAANKDALLVFEEVMLNYLTYEDIAKKYPEIFPHQITTKTDKKGNTTEEIKYTKRKPNDLLRDLIDKSKKFNQILSQVEAEFDIPSIAEALFPVINTRADTELHKMARVTHKDVYPSAVKEIIKIAQLENVADKKSILAFEGFVLDGLSYPEIVEENPGVFSNENEVRELLKTLFKNEKFKEISSNVSKQFGLNANIVDAAQKKASRQGSETGAQWISKTGKEMMAQKNAPEPVADDSEEEEDLGGYVFEKFLAENLDKVMDRVYKRLSKNLKG